MNLSNAMDHSHVRGSFFVFFFLLFISLYLKRISSFLLALLPIFSRHVVPSARLPKPIKLQARPSPSFPLGKEERER